MAPEVMFDNRCSLKSDVWSLGVTFYQMLYGQNPWSFNGNKEEWKSRLKKGVAMPD